MKLNDSLFVVDTHTEGEPTRVILSGMPKLKGINLYEKREYMKINYDYVRTAVLQEPRGHKDQYGAIVFPSEREGLDYEVIFMDNDGYKDMCGHGILGVTSAIIEMGFVDITEPSKDQI